MRRGQTRYGNAAAVLVLTIADREYHALSLQRLTLNRAQRLNSRLRANNAQHTYTTAHDAIVGPLVRQPLIEQQKFQSASAEVLLNGSLSQRTVV